MKDITKAQLLAETMNKIGKLANKETICIITNMDEPVGYTVGNNLEVIEAIKCLKGNMPEDIREIILELGAYMVNLAGINEDISENKKMILNNIENQKAYNKFIELIHNQGGDISYIEEVEKFEKARYILPVISEKSGYVKELNAQKVGEISGLLGAGRVIKEDNIDNTVGIVLCKKISNEVKIGDILAYIHSNSEELGKIAQEELKKAYIITKEKIEEPKIILGIIK